jgi:hypothetical protein
LKVSLFSNQKLKRKEKKRKGVQYSGIVRKTKQEERKRIVSCNRSKWRKRKRREKRVSW